MYYTAEFHREPDNRYSISFPDLPDAISQGGNIAEAVRMAMDCLAETLSARMSEGKEIPRPKASLSNDSLSIPIPVDDHLAKRVFHYQEEIYSMLQVGDIYDYGIDLYCLMDFTVGPKYQSFKCDMPNDHLGPCHALNANGEHVYDIDGYQ